MRFAEAAWIVGKLVMTVAVVTFAVQMPDLLDPAKPPAAAAQLSAPAAAPAPAPVRLASAPRPGGARFAINGVLELDRPLDHGDYAWNDEGVPPGETWVLVDIGAQMLHVYRGGIEIGRSVILYGADDKPTPLGLFPITQKNADHVSNIYGVPMPYMMRLTNDGVAIHGSNVEFGSATNGCVGVPEEFAALLFGEVKLGDKVLIVKDRASAGIPEDKVEIAAGAGSAPSV